ncbi:MAG TPA: LTA synthase family protein [Sphingomonas sp.]|nr:LTA synthase family protein [Sphingomonas sp.]
MVVASLLLDAAVRPRSTLPRRWQGSFLHLLAMTSVFALWLAIFGDATAAAVLAIAAMALFTVASNAKHRMLGEPLVFSDLALIAGIFRHPRFYFTAIPARQRWLAAIGASAAVIALLPLISPRPQPHLMGAGLLLLASGVLWLLLRTRSFASIVSMPDLAGDVGRFGLIATLLLYWRRWRRSPDPAPCPTLAPKAGLTSPAAPQLIIVVQCESFADPVEITGQTVSTLPGLDRARTMAWQHGDLHVSGFGAYTMRTEYGLLFGRSETALGFRRFDPFLTAHSEASYALPARLAGAGYQSSFVHPHDMRFYSRDRLMPAIGFDEVIGESGFTPVPPGGGRYVDDRTLGAALVDLAGQAATPRLIYAVTMENHGPWDSDNAQDATGRLDAYLGRLRSSDAMLDDLIQYLSTDGRPALLVFFGDHRPSIPGVTAPGGARHTPYVVVRFDAGGQILKSASAAADLTPAALHHLILRCVQPDVEVPDTAFSHP